MTIRDDYPQPLPVPGEIILASTSAARIEMLTKAQVPFTSSPARIDEDTVKQSLLAENAAPRDIADALAELKALRISAKHPAALVIGSDQVADLAGTLLSKPSDMAAAEAQLRLLRGKTHDLFSAVVIAQNGRPLWRHIGRARLTMRPFSDRFLSDYLNQIGDEALHTVGSYKIEQSGVTLFSRIEGDHFTILGMPLIEVLNHLMQIGAIPK